MRTAKLSKTKTNYKMLIDFFFRRGKLIIEQTFKIIYLTLSLLSWAHSKPRGEMVGAEKNSGRAFLERLAFVRSLIPGSFKCKTCLPLPLFSLPPTLPLASSEALFSLMTFELLDQHSEIGLLRSGEQGPYCRPSEELVVIPGG